MRLSHIKLTGFKSFAEHTTIEVKGNRVAIVGPNGCGKSNVIDAVRWVLGESSAKHMRGESMQDVIFNGSSKRKSVSRATVELVFDNSQKGLSGLWNTYDEISIKRLISRNGDSNYYINSQVVRRKDITELFLGTGVGTKGYAIIEQGMISRIIESRPEELRQFLEEAAGVSKYREKRKDTIARLQDTKDNLVRVEDIQQQLIKQIEVLQIQADDAKHYQNLHNKLKSTQLTTILIKIDKTSQTLSDINVQIAVNEKELVALTQKLAAEEEVLQQDQNIQIIKEGKLHEITIEFNTKRTTLARFEERKMHHNELISRLDKDHDDLLMQNNELHIQIKNLTVQISEIEEQITQNTIKIEKSQLVRQDLSVSFAKAEQKYLDVNKNVNNIAAQTLQAKHDLDLLNNTKEHKKSQYNNLLNRQKKQQQELQGLDFNQGYFSLQKQIQQLTLELEQLEQEHFLDKAKLIDYRQIHEQMAKQLYQIKNEQTAIRSKISTLNELVAIAIDNKNINQVIDTTNEYLYQLLYVESGYEIAVEIALNNILSAAIIDDINQIKKIPENTFSVWLKNDFVNHARPNSLANFVKLKSDKISAIYNQLNDFVVMDNFNLALELLPKLETNQKLVTRDGHLLSANYMVFNANITNNHVLEYQNQLVKLNLHLDELTIKLETADEELTISGTQIEKISAKIEQVEKLVKTKQKLKHDLQLEFSSHEQIYIQTKNHHEKITQEINLLTQDILYLQDELTDIELKIEEQEIVVHDLSIKADDTDLAKLEYEENYNLAKSSLSEVDTEINQKIIDNQLLNQKIIILHKNLEDKKVQINTLSQRHIKIMEDRKHIESEQQNDDMGELSRQISMIAVNIEEQKKELVLLNNKTVDSRNKISILHKNKENIREKFNHLRLKEQEQLLFLDNQQELLDSLQVTSYNKEQILAINKYSLQELQNEINNLQQQIEALGLVNLKAIEDLEQLTSKHGLLVEQVIDLTDGIKQLQSAIAQIDHETRILLDSTYTKVCESFAIYFKILFGGGSASLELTNNDILNSGIHILIQPPGKRNSSIHLLSGGEKALTAVSLIFAFFNLNPAPFCLLDEVDAPLDDANTSRFCNLVQELSNSTQFIFISHNRLTMEMADQLVGVTMQEQGVSTTVSVSLIDETTANAS